MDELCDRLQGKNKRAMLKRKANVSTSATLRPGTSSHDIFSFVLTFTMIRYEQRGHFGGWIEQEWQDGKQNRSVLVPALGQFEQDTFTRRTKSAMHLSLLQSVISTLKTLLLLAFTTADDLPASGPILE